LISNPFSSRPSGSRTCPGQSGYRTQKCVGGWARRGGEGLGSRKEERWGGVSLSASFSFKTILALHTLV